MGTIVSIYIAMFFLLGLSFVLLGNAAETSNVYDNIAKQLTSTITMTAKNGYNTFKMEMYSFKYTCIFSNYTTNIIIEDIDEKFTDLVKPENGNSQGKIMNIYKYDANHENHIVAQRIANCIIGSSGVYKSLSFFNNRNTHLFFYNKAFKYSKKNNVITVNIVDKYQISEEIKTIKSNKSSSINQFYVNNNWVLPRITLNTHDIKFDMTYERTFIQWDTLKEQLPSSCCLFVYLYFCYFCYFVIIYMLVFIVFTCRITGIIYYYIGVYVQF
eukprot:GHVR01086737.1.p1 GENE.GHVR01086737.1~~GHVR01086737.1.p1  ORF type:complete len:271 (+),score=32.38 GHVR01086737.1:19-831(+)